MNMTKRELEEELKKTSAGRKFLEEAEPCEDAISRKAVVEYIKASDADLGHDSENEFAVEDILTMPSVTPARPKGHWINIDKTHSKCDKCESIFEIVSVNGEANYCPNCGAKMEREE